jgi:hypothetical protein
MVNGEEPLMAHTDVIERLSSCRLSGGKPEMVDVRPNRRE